LAISGLDIIGNNFYGVRKLASAFQNCALRQFPIMSIAEEAKKDDLELKIVVEGTIIDQYERPHKLLPFAWKYNRNKKLWVSVPHVESILGT